jgi:hypothetical protein
MAGQSSKVTGRGKAWLGCGLGGIVIAIVVIGVVTIAGALLYLRSVKAKQKPLTYITTPRSVIIARANEPVEVEAVSEDPLGVIRLEMYADGALVLVQESTLKDGSNPLVLSGSWTPQTSGRHILSARGYTNDKRFSDSSVAFVDVEDAQASTSTTVNVDELPRPEGASLPSLQDIAAKSGISLGDLLSANPDLHIPDPAASLPPGTSLTIPPHPSGVPSGGPTGSPAEHPPIPRRDNPRPPSGLVAQLIDCTGVRLTWIDSPDEGHYLVSRQALGERGYRVISDPPLPADTTTFTDTFPSSVTPGSTYTYRITAVRGSEEGFIEINVVIPSTCPEPAPRPGGDLLLTLYYMQPERTFQSVYCYVTINRLPADRFPRDTFSGLRPLASGQIYFSQLPNRGQYVLSHQPPDVPVDLWVECLGVNGNTADSIGRVITSIPPEDWHGSLYHSTSVPLPGVESAGSFDIYYCLSDAGVVCADGHPGMPPDPPFRIDPYLLPPTNLDIRRGREGCYGLPTEMERVACIGEAIVNPRLGQLVWLWDGGGYYSESDLTAYHITLIRTNLSDGASSAILERDSSRGSDGILYKATRDNTDRSACGVRYSYTVSAVSRDRESAPSNPLNITTESCFEPVDVTVRLDRMTFSNVEDLGQCHFGWPAGPDTEIEVYGTVEGFQGPDHWIQDIPTGFRAAAVQHGTYTFPELFGESYQHTFHLTDRRQSITVWVYLMEHDSSCLGELIHPGYRARALYWELESRSIDSWRTLNEPHRETSHASEFDVTLEAVATGR